MLLKETYNHTSAICCAKYTFSSTNNNFIICSDKVLTKAEIELEVIQMEEATSLRHASEWGMRAIQGAFPRLKDTIQYESVGK
jgi:hypothetical protein